jgi:transposase
MVALRRLNRVVTVIRSAITAIPFSLERRQVTEIPPVRAEVTEHQIVELECRGCGARTRGRVPDGVTAPVQDGPRAAALGAYVWHGQFLSRDRACAAMADMFGCAPSPGALAAMTIKIAATRYGIGWLDALTQAAQGHPWIPGTT